MLIENSSRATHKSCLASCNRVSCWNFTCFMDAFQQIECDTDFSDTNDWDGSECHYIEAKYIYFPSSVDDKMIFIY
jgi:hypothetical protein